MTLPQAPPLYPTPAVPPLRRVNPCLTERSRMSGIALSLREEIRAFSHAVFRRMALACGRIVCVPSVSGVGGLLLVAHRRLCVAVAIKKTRIMASKCIHMKRVERRALVAKAGISLTAVANPVADTVATQPFQFRALQISTTSHSVACRSALSAQCVQLQLRRGSSAGGWVLSPG